FPMARERGDVGDLRAITAIGSPSPGLFPPMVSQEDCTFASPNPIQLAQTASCSFVSSVVKSWLSSMPVYHDDLVDLVVHPQKPVPGNMTFIPCPCLASRWRVLCITVRKLLYFSGSNPSSFSASRISGTLTGTKLLCKKPRIDSVMLPSPSGSRRSSGNESRE